MKFGLNSCKILLKSFWNPCDIHVKSLCNPCGILVKPVWNLWTTGRSGCGSNPFCETVTRGTGAAVGRTRSTNWTTTLSNDEAERPWVELVRQNCRTMKRSGRGSNSFDKIVERRTPSVSEGLLQPSMNLPSGENILFHTYLPTRVISTIWLSLRGCIIVLLSPFCRQVSHCILQTRILVCPLVLCLDRLIVFVVATFAPYARLLHVI